MKIYEVKKKVYVYWLDACNSGFTTKVRYFRNRENAIKWGEQDLDFWKNYDNQMVPIDEKYKRGSYSITEIETAD